MWSYTKKTKVQNNEIANALPILYCDQVTINLEWFSNQKVGEENEINVDI